MNALLFAAIIATQPNQTGGAINLTDDTSAPCGRDRYIAVAYAQTGLTTWGCWQMKDGLVHIDWRMRSGDVRSHIYPPDTFTFHRPLPPQGLRASIVPGQR